MFVLGKIHDEPSKHSARPADCDRYLQHVLVRTLLHVATKYDQCVRLPHNMCAQIRNETARTNVYNNV